MHRRYSTTFSYAMTLPKSSNGPMSTSIDTLNRRDNNACFIILSSASSSLCIEYDSQIRMFFFFWRVQLKISLLFFWSSRCSKMGNRSIESSVANNSQREPSGHTVRQLNTIQFLRNEHWWYHTMRSCWSWNTQSSYKNVSTNWQSGRPDIFLIIATVLSFILSEPSNQAND